MNVCIFAGRIGREAELRHTPSGDSVLSWPLAVDTGTRDKPATMWLDCSLWGKRAPTLQQYLPKGDKVTVSGRLSEEEYTGKDGVAKRRLRLSVDQVELAPKRDAQPGAAAAPVRKTSGSTMRDLEDDIPF